MKLMLIMGLFLSSCLYAKDVEISGKLDILFVDKENGEDETQYYLLDGDDVYRLKNLNDDKLQSGDNVLIKGNLAEEEKEITVVKFTVLIKSMRGVAYAMGGRIMHAILDFNDGRIASDKIKKDDFHKLFFGSDPESYVSWNRAATFGAVNFQNPELGKKDIFGPLKLPMGASCSFYGIQQAADKMLKEQGVDLSVYKHRSYIVNTRCGWAGIAQVRGDISLIQSNYAMSRSGYIYAHELGHNFGLLHANKPGRSYADHSCPMGAGWTSVGYNAPHIDKMNWLADVDGFREDVQSNSDHKLKPLGVKPRDGSMPAMLRIKRDDGNHYWVSYRQPLGLDLKYKLKEEYYGVAIHERPSHSYLLKVLKNPGDTFEDKGVKVELKELVALKSASVSVSVGDDPKPPDDPECKGDQLELRYYDRYARVRKVGDKDSIKFRLRNLEQKCKFKVKLSGRYKSSSYKYITESYSENDFELNGGMSKDISIEIAYKKKRWRKKTYRLPVKVNEKRVGLKYKVRLN